jgi:hypothetical protein
MVRTGHLQLGAIYATSPSPRRFLESPQERLLMVYRYSMNFAPGGATLSPTMLSRKF